MSTLSQLQFVRSNYDMHLKMFTSKAQNEREIQHFRENIKNINSAEEFMADRRVYNFVMKAFGMEEQINYYALVKKVIEEDPLRPDAFANSFADSRYKELASALGFGDGKTGNLKTNAKIEAVIEKFNNVGLEEEQGEKNTALRLALYFERKAPTINSWFEVLADRALGEVVRTAFQMAPETAMMDLDRQRDSFAKRMDIEDFKDPEKLQKFLERFAVFYDMKNGPPTMFGGSSIVSLVAPLSHSMYGTTGIVSFDPVTLAAAASMKRVY